jgi:hypothetical protein
MRHRDQFRKDRIQHGRHRSVYATEGRFGIPARSGITEIAALKKHCGTRIWATGLPCPAAARPGKRVRVLAQGTSKLAVTCDIDILDRASDFAGSVGWIS